jgi:hypothetical protein
MLPSMPPADLIYIDPSRRSAVQKRLFALSDCEPNVVAIRERLLNKASKVLVKISPMADITQTLRLLPETARVDVLSLKNECKELLFLLERQKSAPHRIDIHAVGTEGSFLFTPEAEAEAQAHIADDISQGWLYEPNVSLLKAGAFKLPAIRYGLHKLHPHTHLYHAPFLEEAFPGRIFKMINLFDFNRQTIKTLHRTIPRANVAVRNFCMEAHELKNRLNIKDGGDVYLFGVMLCGHRYALLAAIKTLTLQPLTHIQPINATQSLYNNEYLSLIEM